MEMYEGYHFWGMHLIWWFIWMIFIFWIFAIPYNFPGQRSKREALAIAVSKPAQSTY